ncbi:MAG: hypothetical protein M1121_05390 [Actinobacteria bacterium]|jgi:hypothetical protein|nr:hypothetical protein [Actinomycetota bacterium]
MVQLNVDLPDEVAQELAARARVAGLSMEQVVTGALASSVGQRRTPAFIGIGRAKPGFSVRVAEERMETEGLV